MSVEIVMPPMGESITEGTVSKWLKKVGERVEKDEPVLEISTDKVDAEVPSPGAGILLDIRTEEGETVEVGSVLAVIGEADQSAAAVAGAGTEAAAAAGGGAAAVAGAGTEAGAGDAAAVGVGSTAEIQKPANEQRSTNDEQRTSANEQRTANDEQRTTNDEQPTNDQRSTINDQAVEIAMPQMGESITEGTVSKWLKKVGDHVDKDEALLEISTDKVDAEVPSPAAGTLLSINVQEGETVEVGAVLATVGAEGAAAATPSPKPAGAAETPSATATAASPRPPAAATATGTGSNGDRTLEDLRRTKSSPLVRNIAREHGVDIARIPGSGLSGRVTKQDILSFIESGAALRPQDLLVKGPAAKAVPALPARVQSFSPPPPNTVRVEDRVEKMSVMRKKIAEHMTFSKQTSAHVTSVYEIDMTRVARFRAVHGEEFLSRYGTKLTFMPFIFQAVTAAIREFRIVNAQVDGDTIIYKGDINLGMAVALDWGLIVPVIKDADTLSLVDLAKTANDLADRARTKRLNPDEVQGGTFTITNPGVFGGLFGTPIINQPQVAILCVGTIEKRPKVMTSSDGDDYIAIRQMAYFALTYDHRIVDGADAEKFLAYLKKYLEAAPFSI